MTAKPLEPRGKRLSVDLRDGQKERLDAVITWGSQRDLFTNLVDVLIDAIELNGLGVVVDALRKNNARLVLNLGNLR